MSLAYMYVCIGWLYSVAKYAFTEFDVLLRWTACLDMLLLIRIVTMLKETLPIVSISEVVRNLDGLLPLREIDGRDRTCRLWKPSSPSHTLASVPYAVPYGGYIPCRMIILRFGRRR
jgi:hypothetical protein